VFVQERSGAPSLVVLPVCLLGLLCYAVAAAILHKLDQLDLRRAAVVPLCGRDGLFKYEVQVKTGWNRGAGTWCHVIGQSPPPRPPAASKQPGSCSVQAVVQATGLHKEIGDRLMCRSRVSKSAVRVFTCE